MYGGSKREGEEMIKKEHVDVYTLLVWRCNNCGDEIEIVEYPKPGEILTCHDCKTKIEYFVPQ